MPDPVLYSDTIGPVSRNKDDELFLLEIEAVPCKDNPEALEFGGAYAHAIVDAPTLREAEQRMLEELKNEGWEPVHFEDWKIVCRECYHPGPEPTPDELKEAQEQVQSALRSGINLAFHTWPLHESEETGEQDVIQDRQEKTPASR